jgi:hypothetical protein
MFSNTSLWLIALSFQSIRAATTQGKRAHDEGSLAKLTRRGNDDQLRLSLTDNCVLESLRGSTLILDCATPQGISSVRVDLNGCITNSFGKLQFLFK